MTVLPRSVTKCPFPVHRVSDKPRHPKPWSTISFSTVSSFRSCAWSGYSMFLYSVRFLIPGTRNIVSPGPGPDRISRVDDPRSVPSTVADIDPTRSTARLIFGAPGAGQAGVYRSQLVGPGEATFAVFVQLSCSWITQRSWESAFCRGPRGGHPNPFLTTIWGPV